MSYNGKEDLEDNYLGESCYDMFYKKKKHNIYFIRLIIYVIWRYKLYSTTINQN